MVPTGVEKNPDAIVSNYMLEQNYPNPFNPSTNISYSLPKDSKVLLVIYNSLGQEIVRLINNSEQIKGRYTAIWNGKDNAGRVVSSGVYFYQLITNDVMLTKKMQMLK